MFSTQTTHFKLRNVNVTNATEPKTTYNGQFLPDLGTTYNIIYCFSLKQLVFLLSFDPSSNVL